MSDPETMICCMLVSNPARGERPQGWRDRVKCHMRAQAERVTALSAELAEARAEVERLRDALQAHHEWHLAQDRDGGAWGIDPVDAYSESGLCESTIAALEAKP